MGEHARFKAEREATAASAPPKPEEATSKPGDNGAPPPAATAPPAPPPKPAIKVEKAKPIEEIVEGVVRKIQQEPPELPATPPPADVTEKKDGLDEAYLKTLDDDQREEVELARFAAAKMPDKYGDYPQRMVAYLKKVDAYIDGKRKDDPEWEPEDDKGFQALIEEERPDFSRADRRKLERLQISEEVSHEVEAKYKPRIEQAERIARAQDLKPQIDQAVQSYQDAVVDGFAKNDKSPFSQVISASKEKGWDEAKKVDGLATNILRAHSSQAVELAREYIELFSGTAQQVPYNPRQPADSESNQRAMRQQRLFAFIDAQEAYFAQNGGDLKVKAGRNFTTRAQFSRMSDAEKAKHWTLEHQDVLDSIAIAAQKTAEAAYDAELKRRQEEGYVRSSATPAAKVETTAPPTTTPKPESPKATVTPSPGAGNPPPPPALTTVFSQEELDRQFKVGNKRWD